MKREPLTGRGAAGVLLSAFLAGGLIALGGTVFLSLENRVLGASFFSIGLFFIVSMQLWLYTGKIGYLCRNRGSYAVQLGCTLAGNFAGTGCVALLLRQTRCAPALIERASALCLTKLSDTLPSLFLLAVCCGALMYLGVSGYGTHLHIRSANTARYFWQSPCLSCPALSIAWPICFIIRLPVYGAPPARGAPWPSPFWATRSVLS